MGVREKTRARGPRMTMKTRLRVLVGDYDVEPIPLEDDEETARGLSTAGVDADDANEHHLQAVLSAAALKQQALHAPRHTRSHHAHNDAKASSSLNVAIPVPDATGVADNWEELYPRGVFKEPVTMIRFSDTVEESIRDGLAGDNATYFMDEQDRNWLDRYISRKAKGKGKEKEREDEGAPANITEDEFELVMGMFERHVARANMHLDVDFRRENLPKFSEFEPDFRNISQYDFAAMKTPEWLPPPAQLVRIAQAVYQHWCMRRARRFGSPLAPTLLMDETADNENDSYLCFRRREVKQLRKARKQDQVTVDKMIRLQTTLNKSLELAQLIVERERMKKTACMEQRAVLEARIAIAMLKRKHADIQTQDDEDILFEKERRKRPRVEPAPVAPAPAPAPAVLPPTKSARATRNTTERRATSSTPPVRVLPDIVNRYAQRQKEITNAVDQELAKRREADAGFEDAFDVAFQPPSAPLPVRKFHAVEEGSSRAGASVSRMRVGRGGRVRMDRMVPRPPHSSLFAGPAFTGEPLDDHLIRLSSQWKFDADTPASSTVDQDADRFLVDEWEASLIKGRIGLFTDTDVAEAMRIEQTVLPQRPTVTTTVSSSAVPTVVPAVVSEPTLPRISQLSTAARQRDIRPSPPAVVAPPAVPAVPSPSPTTAVPPPERTATPTFTPMPPAPIPTPIRPPSVAPVAVVPHAPPPQVPSTPRPSTPAPINIARSGTPAVPMLPLRPVNNVGPRLAPTPTPKPYNVPLPSTPNMNHQHQNVMNGMDAGMLANGHNGMPNGMMMPPNGHHPTMNGHGHAGVMAGMNMAMANGIRPMSRATTTTPNGFPAGGMQAHMGVNGDASGSQQPRVPSPVRQKQPGANGMISMAQYNAWKSNAAMMPPPQPMNGAVTYAAQAQPSAAQHMYYPTPHTNSGLEPAQMTQLLQAFRPQQYAQQQQALAQHQQQQAQAQHQQHQQQPQQQQSQHMQQMPQMVYKSPQGVRMMSANQAQQAAYYYAQQQQHQQAQQQQLAFMNMAAANGMGGVGVVPMQQHMVQGQPMMMTANGQGMIYAPMQPQQVVQQQPQQPQASGSQPNGAPVPAH